MKPELQGPLGTNEPQNTGIKTMGRGSLPRGVLSASSTAQNLGLIELKKPWDSDSCKQLIRIQEDSFCV